MSIFYTKPVKSLIDHSNGDETSFKRTLGRLNLTALGIGAIIGAGIFVLSGQAAAQYAGPAIILSFVISAVSCAFAGLCYAELASMIPVAGSTYTYAYATLGELIAWIIGWDLILEYLFAASTVSVGWSGYVTSFLKDFGIVFSPEYIAATGTKMINLPMEGWKPFTHQLGVALAQKGILIDQLQQTTAIVNVPAMLINLICTVILVIGIKESANVNNIMVILKVAVILLFIGFGFFFINYDNLTPFIIPETIDAAGVSHYGWNGILTGSAVIFFAYIGFDAVSTAAQEAKDPQKDVPYGILVSLAVSTILYILVALVLTGIVNYKELNVSDPIALAVNTMGESMIWLRPVIKIAAIAGLSSVILVMLMAQPRIFYSMAKDGLLPKWFSDMHPKYKTPYKSSILCGLVSMVIGGVLPIDILGELVSIGTLLAFVIVCAGVMILRKTRPDIPRVFRTPWVPFVPIVGALICMWQMSSLPLDTWIRLFVWLAIGLVIYFIFGKRNAAKQRAESI
ncbi:MAG: amino acid permease [Opitutaceae bacterium]|nr:amino acid permease [Cytophagales bacterium]